jgi:chromosome segregation ATPase
MAIADIVRWLDAPSYEKGIELYEHYGNNAFLLDCFRAKQLPLSRLKKALQAISDAHVVINEPVESPKAPDKASRKMVQLDPSLPKEIQELETKWKQHYAQADALHRDLLYTGTKDARRNMALSILQNMDIVRDIWYRIQYFRETGEIYKEAATAIEETEECLLDTVAKIKNLPTYISKAKKRIPVIDDVAKLQRLMTDIAQKEAELQAANERLKFLDAKIKELGI